MPLINIKILKGMISDEQKAEMILRVSEAVAEIECRPNPKENLLKYTWCIIEEVDFGAWGVGGNVATREMVQDIFEGKI